MMRSVVQPRGETAAVARAQENTQSTHGAAAQASAGRLLLVLRHFLGSSDALPAEQQALAQAYLFQYLDHKISPDKPAPAAMAPESLSPVKGILEFADFVAAQTTEPFNNPEKRRRVFQEIKRLVELGTDHWTKNKFYQDGREIEVDASLGETLNLVCLALQNQHAAYAELGQDKPEDEKHRLLSLFNNLHRLSLNPVCTGGSQHELLFSLNGVYPFPKEGRVEVIRLIEDDITFLYDCMREFLAEQIKTQFNDATTPTLLQVMRSWLKYETELDETRLPELASWLREIAPRLHAYLSAQCQHYGLNPEALQVERYAAAWEDWPCPTGGDKTIPLLKDFFTASKITGQASRNAALEKMKTRVEAAASLDGLHAPLAYYMRLESSYQRLQSYRLLTVCMSDADEAFKAAITDLTTTLEACFARIAADDFTAAEAFETAETTFLEAERRFKQDSSELFIANFFALTHGTNPAEFNRLWQSLKLRKSALLLTDSVLHDWSREVNENREIELPPAAINRVLLHAILTMDAIASWSASFKVALELVTTWLLDASAQPSLENNFRRSYSKAFLLNLQLVRLVADLPFCRDIIQEHATRDDQWLFSGNVLRTLLIAARPEQTTQLLTAIQAQLPALIKNGYKLAALFRLPETQLNTAQRGQILTALQAKLPELIGNGYVLVELFRLPAEQLNTAQRGQILDAVQAKLPELIKDGSQLAYLFSLPETQLNTVQRGQILTALQAKLPELIKNGFQLANLFRLPETQLNTAQRRQILDVVQTKLPELIKNGYQLVELFSLSETQLNPAQRGQILDAVQAKLPELIENGYQLAKLFSLSETQLNPAQRSQILTALQHSGKLPESIQNGSQLAELFSLSVEQLNTAQRRQILDAVQAKLPELIKYDFQLAGLFHLSETQLNTAQREQIWNAVQAKLPELIEEGYQLADLFSLSVEQLNTAQRRQILDAVQAKLPELIKYDFQLAGLFHLSETQLNPAQCGQILDAVQAKLPELIKDGTQLAELFSLSVEQLNTAQREQILTALQDKLPAWSANGSLQGISFQHRQRQGLAAPAVRFFRSGDIKPDEADAPDLSPRGDAPRR